MSQSSLKLLKLANPNLIYPAFPLLPMETTSSLFPRFLLTDMGFPMGFPMVQHIPSLGVQKSNQLVFLLVCFLLNKLSFLYILVKKIELVLEQLRFLKSYMLRVFLWGSFCKKLKKPQSTRGASSSPPQQQHCSKDDDDDNDYISFLGLL